MSYRDFKKCCKKKGKKENKMNFEDAYLGNGCSNLELEVSHTEGICTEKFVYFCSRCVKLQKRENGFFTPVKYSLVCRAP